MGSISRSSIHNGALIGHVEVCLNLPFNNGSQQGSVLGPKY